MQIPALVFLVLEKRKRVEPDVVKSVGDSATGALFYFWIEDDAKHYLETMPADLQPYFQIYKAHLTPIIE